MGRDASIVILDGGRRLPRADILHQNKEPGLFSRFSTTQLGGKAIAAAVEHTRVPRDQVGHVVMGMAQHSHRDSIYAAQGMRWRGGLPHDVPALTVARICGSGAEALAVGAEIIAAGLRHDPDRPFVVVGGAESMQYPFTLYNFRGRKVGEAVQKFGPVEARALPAGTHLADVMLAGLYDPSAKTGMANTAEELGRRYRITREQADTFGLRSHRNAKRARDAGWFDEEIEPVEVRRDGASPPITAGNASAVVDGAAAMVIGLEADASRAGLEPLARIAGMGVAGCAPEIMGWGPVPAAKRALHRAGIQAKELDIVELNEAFAPQALACIRDFDAMGIDPERVNPVGNAIALGHPLGATGAILTLTCAYALRRTRKRYGLVTMCIGGGQGIALVLESMA
jgi:acetyl-CoA acetyltransferase